MKNGNKTAEKTFDIDDAMVDIAASIYVALGHLDNLYSSVNPAIVWNETDEVREARRIAGEVKFIVNKLIYVKELGRKIDEYYAETE